MKNFLLKFLSRFDKYLLDLDDGDRMHISAMKSYAETLEIFADYYKRTKVANKDKKG